MFTELFMQLPGPIQLRLTTLATGMGLDPVFVFLGIGGVLIYIIVLIILVQVHEKIVRTRKNALEAYTFAADTVLYEVQKGIYNNLIDSTNGDWISHRNAAEKYSSAYETFQEYAEKISPELSKSVYSTHKTYSAIHGTEKILGYFLVVITIGAYKVFWQS